MSNYAFLRVGRHEDFDEAVEEPSARVVASCANGVPLLWLAMFGPEEVRALHLADDEGEAFIGLVAAVSTAAKRLRAQHQRLSALFDGAPPLNELANMLLEAIAGSGESVVQADLTEVALMGDGEEFVSELKMFLSWLGTGHWGEQDRGGQISMLSRLLGRKADELRGPREFVRVHCNLSQQTVIPDAARVRKFSALPPADVLTVNFLLGASWDDPLPWEST